MDEGREVIKKGVVDADVVHGFSPCGPLVIGCVAGAACGRGGRAGPPKKRARFSFQTAWQCGSSASWGPSAPQWRSSAERSSGAETDGTSDTGRSAGRR